MLLARVGGALARADLVLDPPLPCDRIHTGVSLLAGQKQNGKDWMHPFPRSNCHSSDFKDYTGVCTNIETLAVVILQAATSFMRYVPIVLDSGTSNYGWDI